MALGEVCRTDDVIAVRAERMVFALVKRVAVLPAVAAAVAVLLRLLVLVDELGRVDQDLPDTLFGPGHLLWAPC